jgi:putative restriction endonuclease
MVKLFVGVTDMDWFNFLSAVRPDEVNFWAPSGRTNFRALQPGELFLFKLHAPNNFIVGGGVFASASNLPLSLAWDAFGKKNGVGSLAEMRSRILRYRTDLPMRGIDPTMGCRVLTSPFFWPRERWLPVPTSWSRNIVVGRGYSTDEADGASLWAAVMERTQDALPLVEETEPARYGSPTLVKPRLGQGAFRVLVTDAYERRRGVR